MNNATKAVIKYAHQVAWCVVSAIATSAGTTLWHTVLKPKVLDMADKKKQANKVPIGFRMD